MTKYSSLTSLYNFKDLHIASVPLLWLLHHYQNILRILVKQKVNNPLVVLVSCLHKPIYVAIICIWSGDVGIIN